MILTWANFHPSKKKFISHAPVRSTGTLPLATPSKKTSFPRRQSLKWVTAFWVPPRCPLSPLPYSNHFLSVHWGVSFVLEDLPDSFSTTDLGCAGTVSPVWFSSVTAFKHGGLLRGESESYYVVQPETESEHNSCVWRLLNKSANASWSGAWYYRTLPPKPFFSEPYAVPVCVNMIRYLAICHFYTDISAFLRGQNQKAQECRLKGKGSRVLSH